MNRGALSGFKPEFLTQFASQPQTVPAAGTALVVSHGLGFTPSSFRAHLVCVVADAATACVPGDVINITALNDGTNAATMSVDATFLRWIFVGGINICHKTTGARTAISSGANWRLVLYAQ